MQLVLDTNGIIIKKKNNVFLIATKQQTRMISPHKITSIAVLSDCLISSAAIRMAAAHQIPIFFFSRTAKVEAVVRNPYAGSISTIRKNQAFFCVSKDAIHWIISLFDLKKKHQIDNLLYLKNRKVKLTHEMDSAIQSITKIDFAKNDSQISNTDISKNSLLGIEGSIARIYLQTISKTLPKHFQFDKRSRQPALDFFNAALNYCYGMLYSIIEGAIQSAGLDPYFGIMHTDQYRRPSFVYDLIEPFRPWIDRMLIDLCLYDILDESHFVPYKEGYHLSKKGKHIIIPRFNDFMQERRQFAEKRMTNKNHIYHYAGSFASYLKGLSNSGKN